MGRGGVCAEFEGDSREYGGGRVGEMVKRDGML